MSLVFEIEGEGANLEIYEDKVVIKRKGILSAATMRADKTIYISAIGSINLKNPGMISGGILNFGTGNSNETINLIGSGVFTQFDDNSFIYLKKSHQAVLKAKEYIEKRMLELKNPTSPIQVQQLSAADELRKFKQLLDDGIISQAEFDEKKKQLL